MPFGKFCDSKMLVFVSSPNPVTKTFSLCLFSLQRFFVLDNGILKYSKSPIDVSNSDYNSQART